MVEYAALDAYATRAVYLRMAEVQAALASGDAVRIPDTPAHAPPATQLQALLEGDLRSGAAAAAVPVPAAAVEPQHGTPAPAPGRAATVSPSPPVAARNVRADSSVTDDFSTPVDTCQPVRGMRGGPGRSRRGGRLGTGAAMHERVRGAGPAAEEPDSTRACGDVYSASQPSRQNVVGMRRNGMSCCRDDDSAMGGKGTKRTQPRDASQAGVEPEMRPVAGGSGFGKGMRVEGGLAAAGKAVFQPDADTSVAFGRGRGPPAARPCPKRTTRVRGSGPANRGAGTAVSTRCGGHAAGVPLGKRATHPLRVGECCLENDFGVPERLQKPSQRGGLSGAGRVVGPTRRAVLRGISISSESVATRGGRTSPVGTASGSKVSLRLSPAMTREGSWGRSPGFKSPNEWKGRTAGGVPDWVGKTGEAPPRSPAPKAAPTRQRTRSAARGTQPVRDLLSEDEANTRRAECPKVGTGSTDSARRRADPPQRRLPARAVRRGSGEADGAVGGWGERHLPRTVFTGRAASAAEADGGGPRGQEAGDEFDARAMPNVFYVRAHEEAQREFEARRAPEVVRLADVSADSLGRLPIAAPSKSYFDIMEAYFATVEAVAADDCAGAEWLQAWHVQQFKESDLYKRMLAYFGGM